MKGVRDGRPGLTAVEGSALRIRAGLVYEVKKSPHERTPVPERPSDVRESDESPVPARREAHVSDSVSLFNPSPLWF